MSRKRLVAISYWFLVLSCVSCDVRIPELGRVRSVTVFNAGRHLIEKSTEADSREDRVIRDWLRQNRTGWSPSVVSYAPATVIRGDDFSIKLFETGCVLNYKHPRTGDWHQVTKSFQRGINDFPLIEGAVKDDD